MKTVYLQKVQQYGVECYIGKIDPRLLVKVADKIEMGEVQDAQRPLDKKRVKSIASYVGEEEGIIPSTLTIATKDERYSIKKADFGDEIYFMEFPSKDSEFEKYEESIRVMDGQHRLYSFQDEFCCLKADVNYEIGFTLYIRPSIRDRRNIFLSCNEKQEKVSSNLLMWLRDKLDLLTSDEKKYYGLVSKLSAEYPLQGHIIMSAEKHRNGVKAQEIVKALDLAKIENLSIDGERLSEDQLVSVITTYLAAWQKVVGFSFTTSKGSEAGPAVKMSGLRFMILLLPNFWDRAITKEKPFNAEFVEDTLNKLLALYPVPKEEFFTFEDHRRYFTEKTNTIKFADECKFKFKMLDSSGFNPLA